MTDKAENAVKLSCAILTARATARYHRMKSRDYDNYVEKLENQLKQLIDDKGP